MSPKPAYPPNRGSHERPTVRPPAIEIEPPEDSVAGTYALHDEPLSDVASEAPTPPWPTPAPPPKADIEAYRTVLEVMDRGGRPRQRALAAIAEVLDTVPDEWCARIVVVARWFAAR